MTEAFHRITDWLTTAALGFAIGVLAAGGMLPVQRPPAPIVKPAPVPAPIVQPQPAPVHHTGHFTVSYIEPRYGSPASAAIRDQLAGADWRSLDATFRSYTEGQDELKSLGFTKHFGAADLPILFVQETGPAGAPIIDTLKAPATAAAVVDRVKELRGK